MSSQENKDFENNNLIEEETEEQNLDEEEEESEGRNWNQLIIAVVFVLAVVILWYVLAR